VSAKLCTLQCIFCVLNIKPQQKVKYKNVLHKVECLGYQKSRIQLSQVQINFNCQGSKQHQGSLNRSCQADSLGGGFQNTQTGKNCCRWDGNKEISCTTVEMCAAHKKQNETRYLCNFCIVPLLKGSCFEKYQSVRNY